MQRTGSLRVLERASTAFAHQLPQVPVSATSLAAVWPLTITDNTVPVSSVCAIHILGEHNCALTTAHVSRMELFLSSGKPGCLPRVLPWTFVWLPDRGPLCTDALAHSWPWALCKFALPPGSLLAQTLCKVREDEEQVLPVMPFWPTWNWFSELMFLMTAPPGASLRGRTSFLRGPASCGTCVQISEPPCVIPGWDVAVLVTTLMSVLFSVGGRHFHSGQSPLYEASSCFGVESVRNLVFLSPRGPPNMHDWSSAFFPTRNIGA